jgi:hypothetical protein
MGMHSLRRFLGHVHVVSLESPAAEVPEWAEAGHGDACALPGMPTSLIAYRTGAGELVPPGDR